MRCHGKGWHALHSVLMALAAGVFCIWLLGHAGLGALGIWPAGAAAVISALLVGGLAWRAWHGGAVDLHWDGQCWAVGGQAGRLDVMLDLGVWLLLRLRPEGAARAHWVAVSASDAGPAMHGLRAALYARVPSASPSAGPIQAKT